MASMTPNANERAEWKRCADALQATRPDTAHLMAVSALRSMMSVREFDAVSTLYRNWLVFNA